jgi:hypothetical protein
MPYDIIKKGYGWKVCKSNDNSICFSKKPLPKYRAESQRSAIILSELEARRKK